MITYKTALDIAKGIKADRFPDFKHGEAVETEDRWIFIFSVDKETVMAPAPMFFVFKEDGSVEWFNIPPLKNLELINNGKKLGIID